MKTLHNSLPLGKLRLINRRLIAAVIFALTWSGCSALPIILSRPVTAIDCSSGDSLLFSYHFFGPPTRLGSWNECLHLQFVAANQKKDVGCFSQMRIRHRPDIQEVPQEVFLHPEEKQLFQWWQVFVPPKEFSPAEYQRMKSCLSGNLKPIERAFAADRERKDTIRMFDVVRGIDSIVYAQAKDFTKRFTCIKDTGTSGFYPVPQTYQIEVTAQGIVRNEYKSKDGMHSREYFADLNAEPHSFSFPRFTPAQLIEERLAILQTCREERDKTPFLALYQYKPAK